MTTFITLLLFAHFLVTPWASFHYLHSLRLLLEQSSTNWIASFYSLWFSATYVASNDLSHDYPPFARFPFTLITASRHRNGFSLSENPPLHTQLLVFIQPSTSIEVSSRLHDFFHLWFSILRKSLPIFRRWDWNSKNKERYFIYYPVCLLFFLRKLSWFSA